MGPQTSNPEDKAPDTLPVKKWGDMVTKKEGFQNRGAGLTIIAQPIQSSNYVPQVSGWKIDSNGNADLNAVSVNMNGGQINLDGGSIINADYVSGTSGGIDFNSPGRIEVSTYFDPPDGGTYNLGGSARYWNEVNVKEVVKRGGGGFGWYDEGVKLQDGRVVSDTEALKQMRPHPTRKTPQGKPIIDMESIPADVISVPINRKTKEPIPKVNGHYTEVDVDGKTYEHDEGENVFVMMSIMIGAIKELTLRLEALEKK